MKILLKIFSFLLVAGVMAGCSKNDDENGGGSNWKPNLGDYDPVPLSDFDNGFYKWCVGKFDATGDGILQYGEIKTVEKILFYREGVKLSSLKGIKYFTSLKYLWDYSRITCPDIESLDVSCNTMLDTLMVGTQKLKTLIVGKNSNLKHLDVSGASLTSLDVSKCPNLGGLVLGYCSLLTSLDLSKNRKLGNGSLSPTGNSTGLSCSGNLQVLYVWKGWTKDKDGPYWTYPKNTQIIEK